LEQQKRMWGLHVLWKLKYIFYRAIISAAELILLYLCTCWKCLHEGIQWPV